MQWAGANGDPSVVAVGLDDPFADLGDCLGGELADCQPIVLASSLEADLLLRAVSDPSPWRILNVGTRLPARLVPSTIPSRKGEDERAADGMARHCRWQSRVAV